MTAINVKIQFVTRFIVNPNSNECEVLREETILESTVLVSENMIRLFKVFEDAKLDAMLEIEASAYHTEYTKQEEPEKK